LAARAQRWRPAFARIGLGNAERWGAEPGAVHSGCADPGRIFNETRREIADGGQADPTAVDRADTDAADCCTLISPVA
jgi:hypothetical protein